MVKSNINTFRSIFMSILVLMILIGVVYVMWKFNYKNNSQYNGKNNDIKKLIRQSARYSVAGKQDASPIIAMLHANYGAGYLWAVKDIANDNEINVAVGSGFNVKKFEQKITQIQDEVNKRVSVACPKMIGENDPYLSQIAGQNV